MDERGFQIIKSYIDSTKTFNNLCGAGLALPLIFNEKLHRLFESAAKIDGTGFKFVISSWVFFLTAILAGVFYQYVAIKYAEYKMFKKATYVNRPLKYFVEGKGPGPIYGVMVISFFFGAVSVAGYSYAAMFNH
ncbi:MAG: hypothetical protein HQL52_00510 [Magnetococcales bacterium]|nr:hypothetical protein [Magnetococcales bacterium]